MLIEDFQEISDMASFTGKLQDFYDIILPKIRIIIPRIIINFN